MAGRERIGETTIVRAACCCWSVLSGLPFGCGGSRYRRLCRAGDLRNRGAGGDRFSRQYPPAPSPDDIGPANGLIAQIGSVALTGPPIIGFFIASSGWTRRRDDCDFHALVPRLRHFRERCAPTLAVDGLDPSPPGLAAGVLPETQQGGREPALDPQKSSLLWLHRAHHHAP